ISELIDEIAGELKLSESDTSLLVPSGRQTVLSNRLHWAKTYLQRAGLVESTRHGYFKITNRGRELLGEHPAKIDNRMLSRFPEFVEWKSRSRVVEEVVGEASLETIGSPDDQITANVERLT